MYIQKIYILQQISFDYVQWYQDRIGTETNAGINKGGDNRFGKLNVFIKMVPKEIAQILIKDKINNIYPDGTLILHIEHDDERNEKITSKKQHCSVPYWYMADTYNKRHTWQQEDEIQEGVMRDLHKEDIVYILPTGNLTYDVNIKHKNPNSHIWQT